MGSGRSILVQIVSTCIEPQSFETLLGAAVASPRPVARAVARELVPMGGMMLCALCANDAQRCVHQSTCQRCSAAVCRFSQRHQRHAHLADMKAAGAQRMEQMPHMLCSECSTCRAADAAHTVQRMQQMPRSDCSRRCAVRADAMRTLPCNADICGARGRVESCSLQVHLAWCQRTLVEKF